ncbi:MAG: hypothetical protein IPH12_03405 [Saprospirales bacterium]|nr:hypothetical protein [Saprospirales bacterium]MBK8921832.1 hypothetical protein [Saprospirales bacterium]
MNQTTEFFKEFEPVGKQQWLDRIARDLKGKPLDDLYWHLNGGITVDPFGHADDQPAPPQPLAAVPAVWDVNEDIEPAPAAEANRQALEALAFGASSLHFQPGGPDLLPEMEVLLNQVHPGYIRLHFSGSAVSAAPAAALAALGKVAAGQGVAAGLLHGSLYFDPAAETGIKPDWRYLSDLIQYARAEFPGVRCLAVDGRPAHSGASNVAGELAAVLRRGADYLTRLTDTGLAAGDVAAQIRFSLLVGRSYFVEIAKLRAFKILWFNILKAYGAQPAVPALDVRFAPSAYTDDLYVNMIRATTMAMSAVLGGAGQLTVLPYDAGREAQSQYPRAFGRRMARNVQHLLQLESGFGALVDPAAGSFYIENLTAQLADAAWKQLHY